MDTFEINKKFDDYESLLTAKKQYEKASNTILTTESSHFLQGEVDFVASKKYDRISYGCKAGKERASSSKGIRQSWTYKANCPFKVSLKLVNGKFIVTHINPTHQNHETDLNTFHAYPESVRLTDKENAEAVKMIEVGASKQRIKAMLSKDRDVAVPSKTLYNLDTKIRLEKQTSNRKDDFKHLIDMMVSVPNSRVRIVTNDQEEFVGLYYQDERMAHVFDKYPEVLFYDATHDLNNKKFPLFIQLCVDGNGNSEICSIFVYVSESREGVGSMIDIFKELNTSWVRTKVILGDKDFADRAVYNEKFDNAVLKICIFHVLRTFRREITSQKRGITNSQRDEALTILQRLVYANSEERYESAYNDLISLNLEHVTKYYIENWHSIRQEWTLFGLNEQCSYMNTTNNRMESLNQKLKLVGNRHANLQSFFENLSISISNISSEKDLAAVRGKMRRSRQCFDDPDLQSYFDLLTPFAFDKMNIQFELASQVEFASIDDDEAKVSNPRNDKVSSNFCTCLFFSSMELPCRHVIKFLMVKKLDVFAPKLCATRWTKEYFNASHPALLLQEKKSSTKAVYAKVRNQTEINRHKKNATMAKEVNNLVSELSPANQIIFVEKMKDFVNDFLTSDGDGRTKSSEHEGQNSSEKQNNANDVFEFPLDLSLKKPSDVDPVVNSSISNVEQQQHNEEERFKTPDERLPTKIIRDKPSAFSQSQPISILSSIENIKIPDSNRAVGRPKGSSMLTAIGTKRKSISRQSNSSKIIAGDGISLKFIEKTPHQQALTIIEWLTKKNYAKAPTKVLTSEDIIMDANVFNRLRNDEVSLDFLKDLVDGKCFEFLHNELLMAENKPWNCSKCKLVLSNFQVRCDFCFDWFHFDCVQYKKSDSFVCASCH